VERGERKLRSRHRYIPNKLGDTGFSVEWMVSHSNGTLDDLVLGAFIISSGTSDYGERSYRNKRDKNDGASIGFGSIAVMGNSVVVSMGGYPTWPGGGYAQCCCLIMNVL